jgi:hypothetical protein
MSPEIRTGASMPRLIASVNASSICDLSRRGPIRFTASRLVYRRIQFDPESRQSSANRRADRRAVLTDPARKRQHVDAAQFNQERAEIVANCPDEYVQGEPRASVPVGCCLLEVTHIA